MNPSLKAGHFAWAGADEASFGLIFAAVREVIFFYCKKTGNVQHCIFPLSANGKVDYRLPHKPIDWHH